MRIVEPLLPQSSRSFGARKPVSPTPSTRTLLPFCSIETPSSRRHKSVEAQSLLVEKPEICEVPFASAAIIAARCESDLSPGMQARPFILRAGLILIGPILP